MCICSYNGNEIHAELMREGLPVCVYTMAVLISASLYTVGMCVVLCVGMCVGMCMGMCMGKCVLPTLYVSIATMAWVYNKYH